MSTLTYPLQPGTKVVVRFGFNGTQLAEVIRDRGSVWAFSQRVKDDTVVVKKYRANSDSWTKPVVVRRSKILRMYDQTDREGGAA